MRDNNQVLHKFAADQLSCWHLACNNFRALKNVKVKTMTIGGLEVRLQFNPARIISSAAKTDKADLAARKCFLCRENRPSEQMMLKFEGRKGKKYDILLNPYPIFPDHLVIAMDKHVEQAIWKRYVDILDLAKKYSGFVFFYNGPKCGASAPDHHHFQGVPQGMMPLLEDVDKNIDSLEFLTSVQDARLYHYDKFVRGVFVLRADTPKSAAKMFYRLIDSADRQEGDTEPRVNLFTYFKDGEYRTVVIFRKCHRSSHYFSQGPDHLTMSPGCADMAGVFIVPIAEEFEKITPELLTAVLDEVTLDSVGEALLIRRLTRTQPELSVGIMSAPEIEFEILSDGAGPRKAVCSEGKIMYDGAVYDELYFEAKTLSTMFAEPSFTLFGVTIGKKFHWERKENQKFAGALKIIVENGMLTAVNVIGVEDYLVSVISSEMNAAASLEFLKAHSVISRSWVMARLAEKGHVPQMKGKENFDNVPALVSYLDSIRNVKEEKQDGHIVWYGRSEHKNYTVCADDHCQRYQGLTKAVGENVRKAVDATWGEVLTSDGELCDARFSKCCGGVMERFSACWEDVDYPYLRALPDTPGHNPNARPFCDTNDTEVLSQVLNGFDLETTDFFTWREEYDINELSSLISRKLGRSIGRLTGLVPLERGESGRIIRLEIQGTEESLVVGKELEIRRLLSESHLKSSAFDAEFTGDGKVILTGRGWGHGVGLCQIGAAVMASQGYSYEEILTHYYPGSEVSSQQGES